MAKLPMLAITKRVDVSILHEHNCEANIIVTDFVIFLFYIIQHHLACFSSNVKSKKLNRNG